MTRPPQPLPDCKCGSRRRTLVRMNGGRALIEQFGGRRAVFRWPGMLFVVAAGGGGFCAIRADGLHIAGELPDLLGRHPVGESWHSMRPAVANGSKDRYHIGTVVPPAV